MQLRGGPDRRIDELQALCQRLRRPLVEHCGAPTCPYHRTVPLRGFQHGCVRDYGVHPDHDVALALEQLHVQAGSDRMPHAPQLKVDPAQSWVRRRRVAAGDAQCCRPPLAVAMLREPLPIDRGGKSRRAARSPLRPCHRSDPWIEIGGNCCCNDKLRQKTTVARQITLSTLSQNGYG